VRVWGLVVDRDDEAECECVLGGWKVTPEMDHLRECPWYRSSRSLDIV
jgi:hypothetical protein